MDFEIESTHGLNFAVVRLAEAAALDHWSHLFDSTEGQAVSCMKCQELSLEPQGGKLRNVEKPGSVQIQSNYNATTARMVSLECALSEHRVRVP